MFGLSVSECLFYGGIVMMAIAILAAGISAAIFRVTGKKLKNNLEQEYGIR